MSKFKKYLEQLDEDSPNTDVDSFISDLLENSNIKNLINQLRKTIEKIPLGDVIDPSGGAMYDAIQDTRFGRGGDRDALLALLKKGSSKWRPATNAEIDAMDTDEDTKAEIRRVQRSNKRFR